MTTHIHDLGLAAIAAIRKRCINFIKVGEEEGFVWLDELLAECKREFLKPGITLLPKTPSAKQSRRKKREVSGIDDVFQPLQPAAKRSRSKAGEELASIIQEEKPRRTRANSRTESVPSQTRATRQTRNMRSKKTVVVSPEPNVSIIKNLEEEMRAVPSTKEVINTPQNNCQRRLNLNSPLSAPLVPECSPGSFSVKNRVSAFEDLIKSAHSNTSPKIQSPALQSESVLENLPKSPTVSTSQTTCVQSPSRMSSNNISTTIVSTPKCSRRSSRASIRKSLKMLPSKSRLSGFTKNPLLGFESLQDQDISEIKENQKEVRVPTEISDAADVQEIESEDKVKKARTRLRLKKKTLQNSESDDKVCQSEDSNDQQMETEPRLSGKVDRQSSCRDHRSSKTSSTASSSSVSDDIEQMNRSTRTKARKQNNANNHKEKPEIESSTESDQQPDCHKQTKSTRTKMRKKNAENSCLESTDDTCSESEKPLRSTRTKARKNKDKNCRMSTESELDEERKHVRPARTKPRKNTATSSEDKSQASTESEEDKPSRARTKSKKVNNSKQSRSMSRQSAQKCISQDGLDSGIQSVKTSVASSSSSRISGDAKAHDSTHMSSRDSSDVDGFAVPASPAPRTTRTKSRKRQIDEDGANTSLSKRACSKDVSRETEDINLSMLSSATDVSDKEDMDIDLFTDDDASNCSSTKTPSPVCPRDKVVKPHPASFLNPLNKNKMTPLGGRITPLGGRMTPANMRFTPLGLSGGLVKSFIKRDTPTKRLTAKDIQEQRRKELEEKQRKEKERLQKRDVLLKIRIEEQRKKREERMKRVQELKEQHLKREHANKTLMARKLEEKQQSSSVIKEEKLKEDKERQKIRNKKMQEAEDRRKQEEEERQKKLLEQEEEMKRYQEMLQRKKEFEEQERQRKLAEDTRKQEERRIEKEREYREREKQLLLEEERRQLEWQRQKEEKERTFAQERAERERLEQEKRIQKQLALKIEMDKLKEMEKIRIQKVQEYEKKTDEMRKNLGQITSMFNKPNTNLLGLNNSNNNPAMNRTMTLNTSAEQKPYNPDSYDMTPKRKHKPSSSENYDISQIQSDDSTDDEDAPENGYHRGHVELI
ncbi:hypothetical protein ScPMuIL_011849 [Solemya velum]